jgi:hypothetical protein
MLRGDLFAHGRLVRATRHGVRASRMEPAARGRIDEGTSADAPRSIIDRDGWIDKIAVCIVVADAQLGELAGTTAHRVLMTVDASPRMENRPEPAIDVVSQFENLLVESEAVAGRFRDPVADAAEPGFSTSVGVSKPVGASVAASCAAVVAMLALHNIRATDQYFPVVTMAAIPRHIDPSGSRSGRPGPAAPYSRNLRCPLNLP